MFSFDDHSEEAFKEGDPTQPQADIAKLKRVIDACPSVKEMQQWAHDGDVALKKKLTKVHCLLFPLLCWIITSNRCHLKKV